MRIVCFGDSLTAGYPNYTPEFILSPNLRSGDKQSSYPFILEKMLQSKMNQEITIINRGIPGNKSVDLLERYQRDVLKLQADISITMIGSNDLIQGIELEEILSNVYQLHQRFLENSIISIGCTIPPISIHAPHLLESISLYNKNLKDMFSELNLEYLDIFELLSDNNSFLQHQFDVGDGIHLSKDANEEIAKAVTDLILSISKRIGK